MTFQAMLIMTKRWKQMFPQLSRNALNIGMATYRNNISWYGCFIFKRLWNITATADQTVCVRCDETHMTHTAFLQRFYLNCGSISCHKNSKTQISFNGAQVSFVYFYPWMSRLVSYYLQVTFLVTKIKLSLYPLIS